MMDLIIGKEFSKKVVPLINDSKRSIKVIVFDWRWYPNEPSNPVQLFNQAIIQARRRGVSVEVITNCEDIVKRLNDQGCEAKKLRTEKLVHAKLMIIDGLQAVIGSHNYTQNAFTMNHELSIIIDDSIMINGFEDYFKSLSQAYG